MNNEKPVMMYLHGFMSGANGSKQRQLQAMFRERYQVIAPELTADIDDSLRVINKLVAELKPEIIVGTSLGGFMAIMCESRWADVVVVNPVTRPCRQMRRWLNQEQTYFCKRLDGVQAYTLTKETLHKYAGYKFDRKKEAWARLRLSALCSTADELLGDEHVKVMSKMINLQNLMVVDDFGHQCRDAGIIHLRELLERVIARREFNRQAEEDAKHGIIRLTNNKTIIGEIDPEKATRSITDAYCKNGFNGVMHEHCRGAWWREFYKIIPCLREHGEEVLSDGSKFLCPVPISKQMEAVGYAKGLSAQVTLGQYMEWWTTDPKALDINGNRILTFVDRDECTSIDSDGNRVAGILSFPVDEVWQSFIALSSRYAVPFNRLKHCSVEDLIAEWID